MLAGFLPDLVLRDLGTALHQTKRKIDEEGGQAGSDCRTARLGACCACSNRRRPFDLVQMGDAKAKLVLHVADIAG
ncbi:hypothetical protein WI26_21060 [Burkholderia diffusa]|nr:hypothetical protein WI26_21060 [Burkholderia diffusa]